MCEVRHDQTKWLICGHTEEGRSCTTICCPAGSGGKVCHAVRELYNIPVPIYGKCRNCR